MSDFRTLFYSIVGKPFSREAMLVMLKDYKKLKYCSPSGGNGDCPEVICPQALNSASLLSTGQTNSYYVNDDGSTQRGRDFFVLEHLNGFNTVDRFTDTLGTQIYLDDVVIDWSTWNQLTNEVTAYKRTLESPQRGDLANTLSPYSYLTHNDWYPTNYNEFNNICQKGLFTVSDQVEWLNYAPFNIPYQAMWAGSAGNRTARMMMMFATGMSSNDIQDAIPFMLTRTYTFADLGITVPPSGLKVFYNRPLINDLISYATYDEGWMYDNDYDLPFTIPAGAVLQQKDLSIHEDYLLYNNIWGHKFRLCGSTGGYYDFNDSTYKDVNGNPSTFLAEFGNVTGGNSTTGYIIDHLTGLGWSSKRHGTTTWPLAISEVSATTRFDFNDWKIPTLDYALTLRDIKLYRWLGSYRPPFIGWSQTYGWTCTSASYNPSTRGYRFETLAMGTPQVKTGTSANRVFSRLNYQRYEFVTQ